MLKKIVVAFIPALFIAAWLVAFRIWPRDLTTNNVALDMTMFFVMPHIIGSITIFLFNLIFPIAVNRRAAIKIAMPSIVVYLLFFLINYIVTDFYSSDPYSIENIGFSGIAFCFIYFPTGLILMADMAYFGWLGAHMRTGRNIPFVGFH